MMGMKCAAVAFMWSAVFQMQVTCEKSSSHRFLGCSIEDLLAENVGSIKMNSEKLQAMRDRLSDLRVLFVDEISTTAPSMLFGLDKVLRRALNPDADFGGLIVVLLGDFAQLGPTGQYSLAQVAVLRCRSNRAGKNGTASGQLVNDEAARLFTKFRKMDLTEVVRSRKDARWSRLTAGFHSKSLDPPISPDTLKTLKGMRLTRQLIVENPLFQFATVACQTNFEAKIISDEQVFRLATALTDPVFRTISGVKISGGRWSDIAAEGYISMEPIGAFELEQFWVRGMPVVVREMPGCLDPSYGIANGRAGYFHSFGHNNSASVGDEWRTHARHYNGGVPVVVPSPDFTNIKFLFDKPMGPDQVWSLVVPFKAQGSSDPMNGFKKRSRQRSLNCWVNNQ